jgi:hypothetical protein
MENGIYNDISIEAYHANQTHISATSIKHARVSLKQFDWFRRGLMPKSEGMHFGFGNAFELALLDKDNFNKYTAIIQDEAWVSMANEERVKDGKEPYSVPRNSAKYQAEKSKFFASNQGKYFVNDKGKESFEAIEHMLESCYKDETIKKLIQGTEYQLSLFWTDPITGLNLKTRPDICKRKNNVIVNLKTILDGSPQNFSKELANYDYPLQACVEISGCIESGLMEKVDNYFWLVVEKEPPYNATLYEFIKADIDACMIDFRFLLGSIAKAFETNEFPGYTELADNKWGILNANIPAWYKKITTN